jgi:hypothetical protein
MMQFITRHSREHVRRLRVGGAVTRTNQALSRSACSAPLRIRQLSSTASPTTTAGSSSPSTLAIALGTALVGLGSYYVGSLNGGSVSATASKAAAPVYGTPEDFKRAIKELETSFEEGIVSTDPPNLFSHGFSPNVMHEGERWPR